MSWHRNELVHHMTRMEGDGLAKVAILIWAQILRKFSEFNRGEICQTCIKKKIQKWVKMGENIIIISILDKSRSVAPVKRKINLVSPCRQWKSADKLALSTSLSGRVNSVLEKSPEHERELFNFFTFEYTYPVVAKRFTLSFGDPFDYINYYYSRSFAVLRAEFSCDTNVVSNCRDLRTTRYDPETKDIPWSLLFYRKTSCQRFSCWKNNGCVSYTEYNYSSLSVITYLKYVHSFEKKYLTSDMHCNSST